MIGSPLRLLILLVGVPLVASPVYAQAPAVTQTAGPPVGAAVPTADVRDDDAWESYHQAFRSLLTGDDAGARAQLARIEAAFPGHPAARQAASLLGLARPTPALPPPPDAQLTLPAEQVSDGERRSRGARAELVVFQTIHGVIAGAEVCAVLDCQGTRPHALALMVGGGAGVGLSLLGSSRGVTAGQVELLDTGTLWGAWNGFAISRIVDQDPDQSHFWRTMMIGQGSGLALGGLLWYPLRPTSGQVALASTVGIWGTVLTGFTLLGLDTGASDRQIWTTLLIAGDVGLAAGAIAGRHSKISRGRTFLIDAGGVLGLLAGLLVATGMDGDRGAATAAFVGTSAGLGLATVATQDWDLPAPNARLAATPMPGGGVGATLGGTF